MKTSLLLVISTAFFISFSCTSPTTENEGPIEQTDTDSIPEVTTTKTSKKAALLTSTIGEHYLESISSFTGANSMLDFYLDEGDWISHGSQNLTGMREGYFLDLLDEDYEQLNSTIITVSEDLTITFSCNGSTYFTIPFKDDGMDFQLTKKVDEYISVIPPMLDQTTTFVDSTLYLAAKDNLPLDEIEGADIAQIMADAYLLTCNETTGAFELTLFYGDCCDISTYTFD